MAASATSAASASSRRPLTSPGAAVSTMATTPAAEQLHRPGRQPTVGEGAEVAGEAPLGFGAEEVVDQPEEGEGEAREQDHRAQQAVAQLLPHPELGQRGAPGLDHQHRQHDHDPARRGQRVAPVVQAPERRRGQDRAPRRAPARAR